MAQRPDSIAPGTRGPGYARAPQHRVAFVPTTREVRVSAEGTPLVESRDVVVVEEEGYPARYYVSRDDVDMELLERQGDEKTYCPFKGLASYYAVVVEGRRVEDAAWSYEEPYRESELLRDRICFDREKVDEAVA